MEIQENISLAQYTTFKIGGAARYFCVATNLEEVKQAAEFARSKKIKILVLGGGSNMLINQGGFEDLVLHVANKGIEVISEDEKSLVWRVASGEVWDGVVKKTVDLGLWGIENLSHIPGLTGAFAVQNVGAYGQEASQVVENLVTFDLDNLKTQEFARSDFMFGYRQSIFNTVEKGRFVILHTDIRLSKEPAPNLSYRDLKLYFSKDNPSQQEIRDAVTRIRDTKFPFPTEAVNGNAGSFFKNAVVNADKFAEVISFMRKNFSLSVMEKMESKIFKTGDGQTKIPAAFLLDICGVKNIKSGGAQINEHQPLVIINASGTATAMDVLKLAKLVRQEVYKKTGVKLNLEPELVGFEQEVLDEYLYFSPNN